MLTFYTFAPVPVVVALLRTVSQVLLGLRGQPIIVILVLLGMGWVCIGHISRGGLPGRALAGGVFGLVLISRLGLTATWPIAVVGLVGAAAHSQVVQAPWLLVGPVALSTALGYRLGHAFDHAYAQAAHIPYQLTLTGGGLPPGGGLRFPAILWAMTARPFFSPGLNVSVQFFLRDCVLPILPQRPGLASDLLSSTELWSALAPLASWPTQSTKATVGTLSDQLPQANQPHVLSKRKHCWQDYHQITRQLNRQYWHNNDIWGHDFGQGIAGYVGQSFLQVLATRSGVSTPDVAHYRQQAALLSLWAKVAPMWLLPASYDQPMLAGYRPSALGWSGISQWLGCIQMVLCGLLPLLLLSALVPGRLLWALGWVGRSMLWLPLTQILLCLSNNVLTHWSIHIVGQLYGHFAGLTAIAQQQIIAACQQTSLAGLAMQVVLPLLALGILWPRR